MLLNTAALNHTKNYNISGALPGTQNIFFFKHLALVDLAVKDLGKINFTKEVKFIEHILPFDFKVSHI